MNASIILSLAGLLVGVDDSKSDGAKKELEKLQGAWTVTAAEIDGMAIDELKDMIGKKIIFRGAYVELFGDEKKKSAVKVDPSKKPCQIDFIPDKDAAKGA